MPGAKVVVAGSELGSFAGAVPPLSKLAGGSRDGSPRCGDPFFDLVLGQSGNNPVSPKGSIESESTSKRCARRLEVFAPSRSPSLLLVKSAVDRHRVSTDEGIRYEASSTS